MKATIFNIQRMSLHDGPGIRTTVFFKGCTLRCTWCHNPESIDKKPQLQWNPNLCISCGACVPVCPSGARCMKENVLEYDRRVCNNCGPCAGVCPTGAAEMIGFDRDTAEIAAEAEKDRVMYQVSSGGVTCSGGEPLMQADAVADLLYRLKKKGIHTAVDTAGYVPYEAFEKVIPYTDLFLYDLKHWDSKEHKKYTGVFNELILKNFTKLEKRAEIIVRIPFIKGVQANAMEPISEFLKGKTNVRLVEILPYHSLGESKYRTLGKELPILKAPSGAALSEAAEYFKARKIPVKISGQNQ